MWTQEETERVEWRERNGEMEKEKRWKVVNERIRKGKERRDGGFLGLAFSESLGFSKEQRSMGQ